MASRRRLSSPDMPPGGCPGGSHFWLNRTRSDSHIVNPNVDPHCMSGELSSNCAGVSQNFVLRHALRPNGVVRGACSSLLREPPIVDWDDDRWWFEDTVGHERLYGELEVLCESNGASGRLRVTDYSCHELLPFSTIFERDPSPKTSAPLPWEARRSAGWSGAEVGYYDCGPAPPQTVLAERVCLVVGLACLPQAAAACAEHAGCEAAAVPMEGGTASFQLLSALACPPARGASRADFSPGEFVRWRSVWTEAPNKLPGTVEEHWNLTSAEATVLVKFPHKPRAQRLPANQLDVLRKEKASHVMARKIREREMVCEKLRVSHSCDVNKRADAVILFEEFGKSERDCQSTCRDKAGNSSLEEACCVYHVAGGGAAVCALAEGEPFKLVEGNAGHYPQKAHNQDPSAFEAAARCYERSCIDDPLCSLGAKLEFEAPPNMTAHPGDVLLFFDFAHPLSTAFSQLQSEDHASIFHITSLHNTTLIRGVGRLIRVVGSVPHPTNAGDFITATSVARQHTGFVPERDSMGELALSEVQDRLFEVCQDHGKRFHRQLFAPRLDAETRDTCLRKYGVHSPNFEPCLMEVGCKRLDPEEAMLPFHGPWFSQLPYDVLAWQQPAPMCCAKSYNIDLRDERQRRAFFEEIDFQEPGKVDLDGVTEQGVKSTMRRTLRQGAKAMKHLLASEAADHATMAWLAGFVKETRRALETFLADLQFTVDSEDEDDDVEVSSDGNSFLQAHEEGDLLAPSGRRAFEVARWSEDRGVFLQVASRNGTRARAWEVFKLVPGAIYNHGIKPVWRYVLSPLARWGISVSRWVLEHPRAALFVTKVGLQIRHRLCEKASVSLYGHPETQAVGVFSKVAGAWREGREYLSHTFTPAVLLTMLQDALDSTNFVARLRSLGSAAFGITMSWAGLATGGAATALIGGMASMIADAALDASKLALEAMIYQEIAKEIPSNLYDMLFSRCLYKRQPQKAVTADASVEEVQSAATETISQVTEQVTRQGVHLLQAMSNFGDFFSATGGGSIMLERSGNATELGLLREVTRGHEI